MIQKGLNFKQLGALFFTLESLSLIPIIIIITITITITIMSAVGEQKKRGIWFVVIALLQLASLVFATSRPLASPILAHQQDTNQKSLLPPASAMNSKQDVKSMERVLIGNGEAYKGLSTLGSRPPSCAHRCGGCNPCEAIQVPTTTDQIGTQYANYEPEGWKCKCGPSFYNP